MPMLDSQTAGLIEKLGDHLGMCEPTPEEHETFAAAMQSALNELIPDDGYTVDDLHPFGWAPGEYMGSCRTCGDRRIAAKRAPCCRPCAVKAFEAERAEAANPHPIRQRAESLGLKARRATWQVGNLYAGFTKRREVRITTVAGWHIHCPFQGFIRGNVTEAEAEILLSAFEAGLRHAGRRLMQIADARPPEGDRA